MDTADNIAAAVWSHGTRTLVTGTPGSPTNQAEEIAAAIWTHGTRTLTGSTLPEQWYPILAQPERQEKVPVSYG